MKTLQTISAAELSAIYEANESPGSVIGAAIRRGCAEELISRGERPLADSESDQSEQRRADRVRSMEFVGR